MVILKETFGQSLLKFNFLLLLCNFISKIKLKYYIINQIIYIIFNYIDILNFLKFDNFFYFLLKIVID